MASKKRKNKNCNIEKLLQFLNEKAELMRLKPTKWELTLKTHLEHLGYRFKNQFPIICKKKYGYIMDFVLLDYNIFIECNSVKYHYSSKEQIKKDIIETSKEIQTEKRKTFKEKLEEMSKRVKGDKNPMYGKKLTEEHKKTLTTSRNVKVSDGITTWESVTSYTKEKKIGFQKYKKQLEELEKALKDEQFPGSKMYHDDVVNAFKSILEAAQSEY